MFKKILLSLIVVTLFIGCNNSLERKTTLIINLGNSRNISPDLDEATYTVSGIKENSEESFIEDFDDPNKLLITGLEEGKWTITVTVKNVSNKVILTGNGSGELKINQTTDITIVLNPLPGNGELDLAFTWEGLEEAPDTINVEANLEPLKSEESLPLSFVTNDDNTKASFNGSIPSGTYIMCIELMVDGEKRGGITEVVTVAQDLLTQGSLDIPIDFRGSISGFEISTDIKSGIAFTLNGDTVFSESTKIAAKPPEGMEGLQYRWYINGVEQQPGEIKNEIILDKEIFKTRNVVLSCVVYSEDLNKVSSKRIVLTYNEAPIPGKLTVIEYVSQNEINLTWNKATDDVTPQGNLVYKLIKGTDLETLNKVTDPDSLPLDDVIMGWDNINRCEITSVLEANPNYFFKVFVKDSYGSVSGYNPVSFKTQEADPVDNSEIEIKNSNNTKGEPNEQ